MKKLLTLVLMTAAVACAPRFALAETKNAKRSPADIATWQFKGSTNPAVGISSHGILYAGEGLVNIRENLLMVATPSTWSVLNVIASTTNLAYAATSYPNAETVIRQPRFPAELTFKLVFVQGGSTSTLNSTVTVSGIDSTGSSHTVRVAVTTTTSRTGFAYVYISSMVFGIFNSTRPIDNADAYINVGVSSAIGLANDIVQDGLYASWENSVAQSSITYNSDYNTFTPNAAPNYSVTYSTTMAGSNNTRALANVYELLYKANQSTPNRVKPNEPYR